MLLVRASLSSKSQSMSRKGYIQAVSPVYLLRIALSLLIVLDSAAYGLGLLLSGPGQYSTMTFTSQGLVSLSNVTSLVICRKRISHKNS